MGPTKKIFRAILQPALTPGEPHFKRATRYTNPPHLVQWRRTLYPPSGTPPIPAIPGAKSKRALPLLQACHRLLPQIRGTNCPLSTLDAPGRLNRRAGRLSRKRAAIASAGVFSSVPTWGQTCYRIRRYVYRQEKRTGSGASPITLFGRPSARRRFSPLQGLWRAGVRVCGSGATEGTPTATGSFSL